MDVIIVQKMVNNFKLKKNFNPSFSKSSHAATDPHADSKQSLLHANTIRLTGIKVGSSWEIGKVLGFQFQEIRGITSMFIEPQIPSYCDKPFSLIENKSLKRMMNYLTKTCMVDYQFNICIVLDQS